MDAPRRAGKTTFVVVGTCGLVGLFTLSCLLLNGVDLLAAVGMCWFATGLSFLLRLSYELLPKFSYNSWKHLRDAFRRDELPVYQVGPSAHSHPNAAADRSRCSQWIDDFIVRFGLEPYSISMSNRDIDNGLAGQRYRFVAKDYALPVVDDPVSHRDVLKFIDVDYYVEPSQIFNPLRPVLIYTFHAIKPCGRIPDGYYTSNGNVLTVTYGGGATYKHQVWNYFTDHVVYHHWYGTSVWSVDTRPTDDRHILVLLTPIALVPFKWLDGPEFERKQYHGDFQWTRSYRAADAYYHMAYSGSTCCVTVAEATLRGMLVRYDQAKMPSLADFERVLNHTADKRAVVNAPFLFQNVELVRKMLNQARMMPVEIDPLNYQAPGPLVYEDAAPTANMACPPLADGAVAPGKSYNNDVQCVQERLTKINNTKQPPPRVQKWVKEFIYSLVPSHIRGTIRPWNIESVCDQQNRPTQRASWQRVLNWIPFIKFEVQSFQKAETYPDIKAPRNISTTPASHRTLYGSYIYAISEHVLKPQPWYAFGRNLAEIAHRVHQVCRQSQFVVPTDFSAFDGTHSEYMVSVEELLGELLFHPSCLREWRSLLRSQYNAKAKTRFGVRYNTNHTRLSGSSDTSAFNTLINATVAYVAARLSGRSHCQALGILGVYGGDDGLTPDIPESDYKRAAELFGVKLKFEVRTPGQSVVFLSREFLDPWTTPNSITDLQRAVRKCHVQCNRGYTPEAALINRALGYLVTDSQTPVLSNWAHAVLRICGDQAPFIPTERSYLSLEGVSPPQFPANNWLVRRIACESLQVDSVVLDQICEELDNANTLADFPTGYLEHLRPQVKVSSVWRGTVYNLGTELVEQQNEQQIQRQAESDAQPPASPSPSGDGRADARPGRSKRNRGLAQSTDSSPRPCRHDQILQPRVNHRLEHPEQSASDPCVRLKSAESSVAEERRRQLRPGEMASSADHLARRRTHHRRRTSWNQLCRRQNSDVDTGSQRVSDEPRQRNTMLRSHPRMGASQSRGATAPPVKTPMVRQRYGQQHQRESSNRTGPRFNRVRVHVDRDHRSGN